MSFAGSERPAAIHSAPAQLKSQTLGKQGIEKYRKWGEQKTRTRLEALEPDEVENLSHLQTLAADDDFDAGIDLSHAGGEMGQSLEADIEDNSGEDNEEEKKRKAEDWRTRCDRTQSHTLDFLGQMPEMMYTTKKALIVLDPGAGGVVPALIREGLMPCTPWKPSLAVQGFVKSLCDIHGVAYRPYLCQQFSIAYDLYLDLRRRADERVMKALGHDSTWHMRHACPTCTYKLEGEDQLIFDMPTTMDGNDSLK
ncbi:hypothetical protein C8R43DRAFT_1117159 [Mycena crocata]|nr:hypothetical protein C8R43DRAFT_1117159 [Mycena crocata]